jgi:peptide/nickel transport system substrate-binding protein
MFLVVFFWPTWLPSLSTVTADEDTLVTSNEAGRTGGRLVVSLRSEPKTLNPLLANDASSREVVSQMTGDLIHINRYSQQSEPALAKSWSVSPDGLHYTLLLRRGLRFSDGTPLTADDVLFSFQLYLDEKVNSPQRDTLLVDGKPIAVRKVDPYTIVFSIEKPYASAERLFDSIAILPRHLLQAPYAEGKLAQSWTLGSAPEQLAGMGPFRLKQYVPGQRLVLERNPYYWKADRNGNKLPYLDEIDFVFAGNEDAEVLRFEDKETDIINRVSAENYAVLEKQQDVRGFHVHDLGPGLEYNFLLLNMNSELPAKGDEIRTRQTWFGNEAFRQALSAAIDRNALNRIIYQGRGSPIWTHVPPGNRLWADSQIAHATSSVDRSRELLKSAGFSWRSDGSLVDRQGAGVEFTIIASSSSSQRMQMATMIQEDLKALGIRVQVVPMEFRAMLDRVFQSHNYEAAVMGLGGGDVDPNSQVNVWLSSGDDHLWHLNEKHPATTWEAEIDKLMEQQMSTLSQTSRKRLFDRVQEIEVEAVPVVFLVSPHVLVGAKNRVRNFQPAVLDPHTLWNSEQLFLDNEKKGAK